MLDSILKDKQNGGIFKMSLLVVVVVVVVVVFRLK